MSDSRFKTLPASSETEISVFIDGQETQAWEGESVAALLLRQSNTSSRCHPVDDSARAPYCLMGVCFECLAVINGVASTQTCQTRVEAGMQIERQKGSRKVKHA